MTVLQVLGFVLVGVAAFVGGFIGTFALLTWCDRVVRDLFGYF